MFLLFEVSFDFQGSANSQSDPAFIIFCKCFILQENTIFLSLFPLKLVYIYLLSGRFDNKLYTYILSCHFSRIFWEGVLYLNEILQLP